ncbi:MAG: hypothetical protein WDN28_20180 [Chthoniobacter sp.]
MRNSSPSSSICCAASGLTANDFVVRLSSRTAWQQFFAEAGGQPEDEYEFFQIVDKAERAPAEKTDELLRKFGLTAQAVLDFMHSKTPTAELVPVLEGLHARGPRRFCRDRLTRSSAASPTTPGSSSKSSTAARTSAPSPGGGRYDKLLSLMSDGKVDLPALGFGMGDVVLANLINDTPRRRRATRRVAEGRTRLRPSTSSSPRKSAGRTPWRSSSSCAMPASGSISR